MTNLLHDFNHETLSVYLGKNVPDFDGLDAITRFSDGQSNPTYKVTSKGRDFVLRAKPTGELLRSAHQVDREFRVMSALAGTGVPVPKMLHLSDDDSPIGTMFFVMEMLNGRVFWDPALPEITAADRSTYYEAMVDVLARLHSVDPGSAGLQGFGAPGNYFARQVGRWTKQYRAAELEKQPQVDWLIDWLADNMPDDDGQLCIVHGDYRLDNLMFAPDASRIIGVLDWELSTLGHPMADLAYQCMGLRLPDWGIARGLADRDRAALRIPSEQEYVATYCDRRAIAAPDNWNFFITFSYFRLIAILQGVIRRAVDGNASNPGDMDKMRAVVPVLASAAQEVARDQ
jgi:aminoglycoside phosphotransferase (APT) family kinase protein